MGRLAPGSREDFIFFFSNESLMYYNFFYKNYKIYYKYYNFSIIQLI